MKNKKENIKREMSKLVLTGVLIFCGAFAVAVLVGWFMGLEGAPEMLAAILGLAGGSVGFYSWKAKAENIIKLGRQGADKEAIKAIQRMGEDNYDI